MAKQPHLEHRLLPTLGRYAACIGPAPRGHSLVRPGGCLSDSDKNGRDSVSVTAVFTAPQTIPAKRAGCAGNNWTATLSSLTVTGATLVISQNGETIYSQSFTP